MCCGLPATSTSRCTLGFSANCHHRGHVLRRTRQTTARSPTIIVEVSGPAKVFISCGQDRNPYRNIGLRVIDNLNQFTAFEVEIQPILLNWDYRRDLPRDVPAGEFERRSLEIVDQSHLLIGVLGPTVPELTRKEILRAYSRQAQGEQMRPYVLADPRAWEKPHKAPERAELMWRLSPKPERVYCERARRPSGVKARSEI